jgi:D-lactate dehydrogenase (cytochrome)
MHRIRTRPPRGQAGDPLPIDTDPPALDAVAEDAAHFPGGRARAVARPRSEADVSAILRAAPRVLPIGAQSSLTGGATPLDDLVLTTARLDAVLGLERDRVRVQSGVPLAAMQDVLHAAGRWYPPTPTFTGAFAGGVVATNAAGAATFKYGSTRQWVEGITVVLASGEVLALERGQASAHPDGYFEIETTADVVRVPVPSYRMPATPKHSAGYFARSEMDLVDLFVGSEGTLGIVTEVTFRTEAEPPGVCVALIPLPSEQAALRLADDLRRASLETWRTGDRSGLDAAAVEHMDRRCLDLLRADGQDHRCGISWLDSTEGLLLVQIELRTATSAQQAYDEIAAASGAQQDTSLARLVRLLERAGVADVSELALPGDRRRVEQFLALREAVPAGVNQRVGTAKRTIDNRIEKTAADMIVPFDRLGEMLAIYREGFERRGLEYAIWGHFSDGNLHPNVIPRSAADVEAGKDAILEFGRAVARLGGCPLAEHGVGRNPVKQALLRQLYGDRGIEEMRRVKRALDPESKLARGVIFSDLPSPARY